MMMPDKRYCIALAGAALVAAGTIGMIGSASGAGVADEPLPRGVLSGMSPAEVREEWPAETALQRAYAGFAEEVAWHGAFAVSTMGGFAWVAGLDSPDAARQAALAACKAQGARCHVVAEITPEGPYRPGLEGISYAAVQGGLAPRH